VVFQAGLTWPGCGVGPHRRQQRCRM